MMANGVFPKWALLVLLLSKARSFSASASYDGSLTRDLKGGRGGGGGGGSRGGGGGYGAGMRSRSYGHSQSGGDDGEGTNRVVIILLAVLIPLLVIGVVAFLFWKMRKTKEGPVSFDDRLCQARTEALAKAFAFQKGEPKSGIYAVKYKKQFKVKEAMVQLCFTEEKGLYHITGNSTEEDGVSTIEEGYASFDGFAWWKETYVTGEIGLQELNKGKFDFSSHTFQGEWWASTGLSGKFVSFALDTEQTD